jgi:ABC-2 type transport system ATP-binding protein
MNKTYQSDPQTAMQMWLEIKNLTVRYGAFPAVKQVSFQVHAGEVFGLLGKNGAGKTSILSVIEGLIKPVSGSVHVAGFDVARDVRSVRGNLGIQLQANSFQADLSVREILRLYAGLYQVQGEHGTIDAILAEFELTPVAGQSMKKLSGGQQQSVSLAIATMHNPPLLLLDEPTTGLDPQSRRRLWERITKMRNDGSGIVLTTHSMEEAHSVCDRIAIIHLGELIALETPQGLIERYRNDPDVKPFARDGTVTLEDVFIGLTSKGSDRENR